MEESNSTMLTIGDTVSWCGHYGELSPHDVEVIAIVITPEGGSDRSLGTPTDSIPWDKLVGENILVGIQPGLWAYGSQLSRKAL